MPPHHNGAPILHGKASQDIDVDFCFERRQEVIDYVVEKYGKDQVVQIVTFGTLAAKNCIRDVGRAHIRLRHAGL